MAMSVSQTASWTNTAMGMSIVTLKMEERAFASRDVEMELTVENVETVSIIFVMTLNAALMQIARLEYVLMELVKDAEQMMNVLDVLPVRVISVQHQIVVLTQIA